MAEDTTNVDDRATHIPDHWVTLDKAPRQLPPIGDATFGHLTNGEHPEYFIPMLIPQACGFTAPVDARTVYRALVDHLKQWQGKGFIQPGNAGARWHLQFREVEEKPETEPGILEAILPGFRVLLLPGEPAPMVHSFSEPSPAIPGEFLPPSVRVIVKRRHDTRCDATIHFTPQGGEAVADDLMARARDLWGELGKLEDAPAKVDAASGDPLAQYEERLREDIGNQNGVARRRLALIAVWRRNPLAVAKDHYETLAGMMMKHDELVRCYAWNVRDDIEAVQRDAGISMRDGRNRKSRK